MGLIERLYEGYQLGVLARFPATGAWRRKHKFNLIRVAVLASSVALMLPGAWGHSVTVVEFAHLPAGLAAWQRGSLGIYRVCGPVSKLLYALPAFLAGARVDYPPSFDSDAQVRREWELGQLFQAQNSERYHDIYRWSRLLPIMVTTLGGCLVCEWSTRLFGPWPGVLSLCVWSWAPPILAHGSLVSSDMASSVALLLSARTFWSLLLRPRVTAAFLAGVTLGIALATKFTLLVLCPCWLTVLAIRLLQHRLAPEPRRDARVHFEFPIAAVGLSFVSSSFLMLNVVYAFQDVGFTLSDWHPIRSSLANNLTMLDDFAATRWLLHIPLPIPLELVRGIDFQIADTERLQSAYLLGRSRIGGWWYWYAAAFLLKLPIPALALFTLAAIRAPAQFRGREELVWASLCLWLPAAEVALVVAITTGTGTNAAFRYLLPSLALLCVLAGGAARRTSPQAGSLSARRHRIPGLLVWLMLDALAAVPDHIGSQNELAWMFSGITGQPALIGDSLDWGQDLARLGRWVSRQSPGDRTLVCAYGLGDGGPYGLRSPRALAFRNVQSRGRYLAVSEEVLYAQLASNYVAVAGEHPTLERGLAETLLSIKPVKRVGRTIRVYSLAVPALKGLPLSDRPSQQR